MPIKNLLLPLLIASCLIASMSGCSAFSSDNLNDALATTAGKSNRLAERVEKFHQALYWGSPQEAVAFVQESTRREMVRTFIEEKQKQKLVDISIDYITYENEGDTAIIDVRVRYYPIPAYVIVTRIDQETWSFDRFGGGWYLKDRKVGQEENRDSFQLN